MSGGMLGGLFGGGSGPASTQQQGRHDFLETPQFIETAEAAVPADTGAGTGLPARKRRGSSPRATVTLLGDI